MQMKRTLIFAFCIVSVVAVLDIAQTGVGAFGSIFDRTFSQMHPMGDGRGVETTPTLERRERLESIGKPEWIAIDPMQGDLRIVRSEREDEVSAEYTLKIWGRGREDAEALADRVTVRWELDDDGARLKLQQPESLPAGIQQVRVEVRLGVPRGVDVSASHFGNVTVSDLEGRLTLSHSGGRVTINNLNGPLALASRFSNVEARGIAGDLSIEHLGGEVVLQEIEGSLTGSMRAGEIEVSSVMGPVEMSVSQGAGTFAKIGGDVRLSGGFGRLAVKDVAGSLSLDARMGEASVEGLRNSADITMQFGEVSVRLAQGTGWSVNAAAERGEIESNLELQRRRNGARVEASGVIGDGENTLRIEVSQGAARIIGTTPEID